MKKFLLGTVGLIALGAAAPAVAADLPARTYTKAPAYVAAVYDWSGFYIGANGGWATSRKCWDFSGTTAARFPNVAEGCHDASGGVVGGQIGYNWQSGAWLFGLEAQGDWADLSGSNVSLAFPTFSNRSRVASRCRRIAAAATAACTANTDARATSLSSKASRRVEYRLSEPMVSCSMKRS